ncbi:uncharacterized protein isoform X2 [Leptinotarsa decemlineata]|uniref:uncharacterized protein isoform X2 n=1 Tax=Leptinotarsa decemlineata TaxID=7539 RepID=UPI003D305622
MPVLRKRAQGDNKVINGLYIHSSPPRVLQLNSAYIKQLIHNGDVDKLEQAVLEGQGRKLIGEYSADYKTRTFLKSIPTLMSKISLLHDAVNSGRLEELKTLLNEEPEKKKRMVMAKDETGVGLLHKAIYYDLEDIYKWLIQKFPFMVSMRDSEGRTAYHYTSMCKDPKSVQKLLTNAGADPSGLDQYQHSAKYYVDHKHELELPSSQRSVTNSRRSTAKKDSLNFKKSNIRIWIHQRNLTNLQQVMWEGHGGKLLVEHSNNPKIKKFLEAVPHIMGLIKDIHTDVQNDDLESLKNHLSPPVPPIVLSGKDSNGLTPLHKAVGLDKKKIAEFILQEYPECINSCDNDGRTPLHYAALVKDDGTMTKFLIQHGADESALDNKQKTAAYYKTRNSEMDSKLLNVVPECPRSAKESFATNFDWTMLTSSAASMNGLRNGLKKMGKNLLNGTDDNENKESSENIEMKGTEEENHEGGIHNETNENEHGEEKEEEKLIVSSNENENSHEKEEENVLESQRETNDLSGRTEDENEDENLTDNIANKISQDAREENTTTPEELNDNNNDGEEDNREDEKIDNRIEAENDADEIPRSPKKSRPNSQINSVTRPNTQEDVKSRPTSKNLEKSRPNSQHISQSRSISESAGKSRPTSLTNPSTRPGSEELETNGSGPIVDDEKVIEGIVHEEDEAMNNEGLNGTIAADTDDDIKSLVESGNMELLASLVLNGEGERLVGKTSENPELQSFLENVPLYMSKIRRIHEAARNGSLRDLQAALDRRKFAIAKDVISPNGASPLHVSVIFGNTSIVRYLAGRFPETVQVLDENDRTPLHYAAVLGDNGHYYNLLVHLGADVRLEDKFGHKPDYYRKNQEEFSHRSLLKEFGVEDTKEFFEDKGNSDNKNGQVDMPFFATEEGRYLAASLGDPLIKGLTEVANKRPEDPIAYLAQYLYNFANNRNNIKSRGRTQESAQQIIAGSPTDADDNKAIPASIDVVTVEPEENEDADDSAFNSASRDEHGQSMLHFAASRSHGRNALFQLLMETEINVAYRDELYRTARDISIQASLPDNTEEIDRYVLHIATKGDTDKLVELLLDGYDHITDIVDSDDQSIMTAVTKAEQPETVSFLQSILAFEEKRERVHHAIRQGSINDVTDLLADENDTGSGKLLAIGKNSYGRCTLHIAVLCQQEEIVDFVSNHFPDTLKLGDNLERTALHYAMGVEKMESISRVLIKAGAQRVTKDLKGRQPTYYFLNKSDILRLQEEEETF